MVEINKKQVVVIGGGPAGTTAAILLAKQGIDVALFEKDKHPRYHVGESMILSFPFMLQLLGVEEELIAKGALRKGGVYFDWNDSWVIDWGKNGDYTYHLERSEFDHLLLEKARSSGVEVIEEAPVTEVFFDNEKPYRIEVQTNQESKYYEFDFLIDASGRNALLARNYLKCQKQLDCFKNVAIWGYWLKAKNCNELEGYKALQGESTEVENPIIVSSIPHGWIWGIPLHNKTMSVGCILSQEYYHSLKKDFKRSQIYSRCISQSDSMQKVLEKGYLVSKLQVTSDWSYYTTQWAGENYFLVGDAAVFIDPLLSTGVSSAMLSSIVAAACIKEIYKGELEKKEILEFYADDYQKRFWRISFTISSLYCSKRYQSEDLFYKSHCLSSNDFKNASLHDYKSSFSSIISGQEDIKELVFAELQKKAHQRLRENFSKNMDTIPLMSLPFFHQATLELDFDTLSLKKADQKEEELLEKSIFEL